MKRAIVIVDHGSRRAEANAELERVAEQVAVRARDAGFEVIFTNFLMPGEVVTTALQEDVDVVGLSILSGAHMTLFPRVKEELEKRGMFWLHWLSCQKPILIL